MLGGKRLRQRLIPLCSFHRRHHTIRLQRFEKTNEKLSSFNELSTVKLNAAMAQFKRHTQQIVEARKDLHSIFRRIR